MLEAESFLRQLDELRSDEELRKIGRYFKSAPGEYAHGDRFIGVRMGHVFDLAKQSLDMPLVEIERLLESDIHEARAGAVSIMAKKVRRKGVTDADRGNLYALYIRRHDRINNWDLVDLGAWHVVGPWLVDRTRDPLYALARSASQWERRTAMLATYAFIRRGQFADTFAISDLLLDDPEPLIHKASGWMLRSIGSADRTALADYLGRRAGRMPRIMLSAAIEHFSAEEKVRYRAMRA